MIKIFIEAAEVLIIKRLNFEFNLIENVEALRKFF